MKKLFIYLIIITATIIVVSAGFFIDKSSATTDVLAQFPGTSQEETLPPQTSVLNVVYPISELENCSDKAACFKYCEASEHGKQCLEFAKKHGLLSDEEIGLAKKVMGVKGGPGGCDSQTSCESYCNDITHIDECVNFAEENGLMKGQELEEAKKVRAAVQSGAKMPGGCRNKNECENYCKNPDHMDECLAFAEAAGFIPKEELEQARKFLPLIKSGQTPGKCQSKEECEGYCNSDEHFNECIDFADKNGLIPEGERKNIEAFKKAGGRGPGGCIGRQCETFCKDPANQEACMTWAKENGLLREEGVRQTEQGAQQGHSPEGIPSGIETSEDCVKYGGEWSGGHCDFGKRECINQGGSWDGKTCNLPEGQFKEGSPRYPIEQGSHITPPPGNGFQGFSQEECAAKGGRWVDNKCSFINPMDTPEYCLQQGGDWIGGKCSFGKRECTSQGGTWDGSKCNFPPPPSPSSLREHPFLGAISRYLLK